MCSNLKSLSSRMMKNEWNNELAVERRLIGHDSTLGYNRKLRIANDRTIRNEKDAVIAVISVIAKFS